MSKTVVITGGSRGIGAATAKLAGQRGWSVVLSYVGNEKAADEAVKAVQASGGRGLAVKCDQAIEGDIVSLFNKAEQAFGKIDGVVNNVGVVAPSQRLVDMDIERIRRVVEINLTGAIVVAREAIRHMAKSRGGNGGVLVNVSSAAAKVGGPNTYVDYAASKGGIESLTLGLSKEVALEGIRVIAVRPGVILTEIHASGGEPERPFKIGATTPMGRPGNPEEVAAPIVWMLSDESSYVTGAILDVSGGR